VRAAQRCGYAGALFWDQQHAPAAFSYRAFRPLQVLTFGYVILSGANILSDGSELLLEILDPGLIGGAMFSESRTCMMRSVYSAYTQKSEEQCAAAHQQRLRYSYPASTAQVA
jgi:hypothetical protein